MRLDAFPDLSQQAAVPGLLDIERHGIRRRELRSVV